MPSTSDTNFISLVPQFGESQRILINVNDDDNVFFFSKNIFFLLYSCLVEVDKRPRRVLSRQCRRTLRLVDRVLLWEMQITGKMHQFRPGSEPRFLIMVIRLFFVK